MTPHHTIWALWDADELVSIHLTEHDAHDARDQHLERYQAFPNDGDLVRAAVEIRTSSLAPDERTGARTQPMTADDEARPANRIGTPSSSCDRLSAHLVAYLASAPRV